DGVNPVVSAHPNSKIAIVGQAPGSVVHQTGIPWDDKSGERLRRWLGVDWDTFYNPEIFALVPMGFCYPGKGASGDLPPREECAPLWHGKLFDKMHQLQLILTVGTYDQTHYLNTTRKKTLTETVKCFDEYIPHFFPLPHPSPRNNIWLKKNPWFEADLLPVLQKNILKVM
ncbi:MAG: uracil-DNA glycosylase family protein, partial [Flavobacteriaceae bacterium]